MALVEGPTVESRAMSEFARVLGADAPQGPHASACLASGQTGRLNLEKDDLKNGLGQLVLTLVKLLHELLEKQAIRRIEAGSLTEPEVERLGITLMRQAQEIDRLRKAFNLEDGDLNIDLGPLGRLL